MFSTVWGSLPKMWTVWTDRQIDGQMDGMGWDGWMDGWMVDGRMDIFYVKKLTWSKSCKKGYLANSCKSQGNILSETVYI